MANFGPLTAEIGSGVWGTAANLQRVSRLGSVTARHSSIGRQPNFAALKRGRQLYSAGLPSRWALAHILVFISFTFATGHFSIYVFMSAYFAKKTYYFQTLFQAQFLTTSVVSVVLSYVTYYGFVMDDS